MRLGLISKFSGVIIAGGSFFNSGYSTPIIASWLGGLSCLARNLLARKLLIAAIIVQIVMKPNPNAKPIIVALPKGVPPSKGAVAVVEDELIPKVDDGGGPFVVVGAFVTGAAVVEGVDVGVGMVRYPLMWKAQTSCTIAVDVAQEFAEMFCSI
jgi:hypothetical protein